MSEAQDRAVIEVVQQSVLASRAELARQTIVRAIDGSAAVRALRAAARAAAARWGLIMIVAAAVHVLLVAALAHPSHFYWLLLPALFAAIGAAALFERRATAHHID